MAKKTKGKTTDTSKKKSFKSPVTAGKVVKAIKKTVKKVLKAPKGTTRKAAARRKFARTAEKVQKVNNRISKALGKAIVAKGGRVTIKPLKRFKKKK